MTSPTNTSLYPVIRTRDLVVFPDTIIQIFIGRPKSREALFHAKDFSDKKVLLVAQRDPNDEDPDQNGLYQTGVIANILQFINLPNGTTRAVLEGVKRVRITEFKEAYGYTEASFEAAPDISPTTGNIETLSQDVITGFQHYAKLNTDIDQNTVNNIVNNPLSPSEITNTIATNLNITTVEKQALLEERNLLERLKKVSSIIATTLENTPHGIPTHPLRKADGSQQNNIIEKEARVLAALQKELQELNPEERGYKRRAKKLATNAQKLGEKVPNQWSYAIDILQTMQTPEAVRALFIMATTKKQGRRRIDRDPQDLNLNALEAFRKSGSVAIDAVSALPNFMISSTTIDVMASMETQDAALAIAGIATGQTAAQKKKQAGKKHGTLQEDIVPMELFDHALSKLERRGDDHAAEALSQIGRHDPTGGRAIAAFQAILNLYKNGLNDGGELREDAPFTLETVQRAAAQLTSFIIDPKNLPNRLTDENDVYGGKQAIENMGGVISIFRQAQGCSLIPDSHPNGPIVSQLLPRQFT